jgi:hypothetical protein
MVLVVGMNRLCYHNNTMDFGEMHFIAAVFNYLSSLNISQTWLLANGDIVCSKGRFVCGN